MTERNYRTEKQDHPEPQYQEDNRRERFQFFGIVKVFDPEKRRSISLEFCPDNTEEFNEVAYLMRSERETPTLDRCMSVCRGARVRARVLLAGQYKGHIFEDGSADEEVERLLP